MIRKLKFLVYVVLGALTLSCSDWLKVSSEDRIMENDLFRTTRGFMTALNGIYIDLLNSSLYGKTLTWGMSDILAQYYTCREKDHASKSLADFDNVARNNAVSGCWSRSYALLNNINTVLFQLPILLYPMPLPIPASMICAIQYTQTDAYYRHP